MLELEYSLFLHYLDASSDICVLYHYRTKDSRVSCSRESLVLHKNDKYSMNGNNSKNMQIVNVHSDSVEWMEINGWALFKVFSCISYQGTN